MTRPSPPWELRVGRPTLRIPLPAVDNGTCHHDSGRAVAQVWYSDGTIRTYCADHDEPQWPLPAEKPFWWRYDWPYGPPPSWRAQVLTWLRSFPLPRRLP